MKHDKIRAVMIAVSLIGMLIITSSNYGSLEEKGTQKRFNEGFYSSNYTEMDPIIINSNTDLQDFATANNIPGNGSKTNPYIFENYFFNEFNFSEEATILLKNTNLYVTIRNNSFSLIDGPLINIYQASNITIENNYFDTYATGIKIRSGKNINITSNSFTRILNGVDDSISKDLRIENNLFRTVFENARIIQSFFSDNVRIVQNTLVHEAIRDFEYGDQVSGAGIYAYITNSLISRNKINNFGEGIAIGPSENTTVEHNALTNNGFTMALTPSDYEKITFTNNSINQKEILIAYNINNTNIDLSQFSQVFLISTNNVTASNFSAEDYSSSAIYVENSNNLYLSNITIKGQYSSQYTTRTDLKSSTNITLKDAYIQKGGKGVYAFAVGQLRIFDSTFENNSYGVDLYVSDSFNISGNQFAFQQLAGINILSSQNGTLLNNRFTDPIAPGLFMRSSNIKRAHNNYFETKGIDFKVLNYISHPVIFDDFQNNTIQGKQIQIYQDVDSVTINGQTLGQLLLVNASSFKITNSNIIGGGLKAWYSQNTTIDGLSISESEKGLYLYSSNNWVVNNVQIPRSSYGIYADQSSNTTVFGGKFFNSDYGIYSISSNNATIRYNSFTNISEVAISVISSNYQSLSNNKFNQTGIDVKITSTVSSNITHNTMYSGIDLQQNYYAVNLNNMFETFTNNTIDGKEVALISNQNTGTTDINDVAQAIVYNSSQVTIRNSNLVASYGIQLFKSSFITIQNNNITGEKTGLFVYSTTNVSLANNSFVNQETSIRLIFSSNITVVDNNMTHTIDGFRATRVGNFTAISNYVNAEKTIASFDSSDFRFENNTFVNATNGIQVSSKPGTISNNRFLETSIQFLRSSIYNDYSELRITNNTLNGLPILFYYNTTGVSIEDQQVGQAIFIKTSNIRLNNVSFVDSYRALSIYLSENITITNSEFANISVATIDSYMVNNMELRSNSFSNTTSPFYNSDSDNVTFVDNTLIEFTRYGVYLEGTINSKFQSNLFVNTTDSEISMGLDSGKNNVFYNNSWSDWFEPDSDSNDIVDVPYKLDGYDENHDYRPVIYSGLFPITTTTTTSSSQTDANPQPNTPTNSSQPPEPDTEPPKENNWLPIIIGVTIGVVAVSGLLAYRFRHKLKRRKT